VKNYTKLKFSLQGFICIFYIDDLECAMEKLKTKTDAINLFGSIAQIAREVGNITPQAVGQWPEILTPRIRPRVEMAALRKKAREDALVNK